jgi:hypothetical protein
MAIKIEYKNHCTPQERIDYSSGSKWQLDGDCGKRLTGVASPTVTIATTDYNPNFGVTSSDQTLSGGSVNFVFVKNTGSTDLRIDFGNNNLWLLLKSGESFCSAINDVTVTLSTASGVTTAEYLLGRD